MAPRLRARKLPAEPAAFRADATYLLTGGLGGLGLRIAGWLADGGARSLVLVGRSQPTDEAVRAIEALRGRGVQVAVLAADVTRREDVQRLIARCGPSLAGVVHTAGTFDDRVVLRLDWSRFERVLRPKVLGAWHLHTLTRNLTLDMFVLVSSAVSIVGVPGLANYAAANAFLDALAEHRRAAGLPALSVGFSAWSTIGMAGAVDEAERRRSDVTTGVSPLAPAEALDALGRALAGAQAHVGVIAADWASVAKRIGTTPAWLRDLVPAVSAVPVARPRTTAAAAPTGALAGLNRAALAERRRRLSTYLTELVASLLALGLDLPSTLAFDHPTIQALAGHLAERLCPAASAESEPMVAPVRSSDLERLFDELEGTSDADILQALSRDGAD